MMSEYIQCPTCKKVMLDPTPSLSAFHIPCPTCGDTGKARLIWPNFSVLKFIEVILCQDLNDDNDRRVAVVFLCTALEVMLEEAIWDILTIHTESPKLAEAIIDSYSGLSRMKKLYNKLSDKPLGVLLSDMEGQEFLNDWTALVECRNKLVHGTFYAGPTKEKIQSLLSKCYPMFIRINDDILRQKKS